MLFCILVIFYYIIKMKRNYLHYFLVIFALSALQASPAFAADHWGIRNCTGVEGKAFILRLASKNGTFKNAPLILLPGKTDYFTLKKDGVIGYKAIGDDAN